MAISGLLSELPLPEIFRLLQQGNKTGRLAIKAQAPNSSQPEQNFYIWFQQGLIIAAANRLDGKGLLSIIQQKGWMNARSVTRITDVCAINQPTGLCLKSQGILEPEQLKMLFNYQVLKQICKLFELQNGSFEFETKTPVPHMEMTGLTAIPKEVILKGLRVLRNWKTLEDKLPEPTYALVSKINDKPQLGLNQLEWQIWEFTKGTVSIIAIAEQLGLPLETIQQAAFRLIVVGLVEEVPVFLEAPPQQLHELESAMIEVELDEQSKQEGTVSQSFLKSLVGFLKNRL
ncbi:DUF4388 domain-containing protein [Anabaena cylindrica FACHB-243]|uniref:PatA-like N-terminal domain-containing protein n=1 Tax=Anabaena cylindrica (strain ATCC 27899 / PCC 7122) TaxID=272123 RepID=K9ZI77_ANACC|nr:MULTISPECIES: DUF4388 domain-containing protein [Anabaena]AFZ58050.1 hypothetical protein Anacy_2609 [Anabaena cylindrica PCC 7122]MBD2419175.1 DUF4388 domain-containing protein [Anabaena cylindrica FACHB-243]MBY5284004.1 DUF4388 domain-containing protein [Anabaena sp. CCAP 1446/1C]MBY5306859.1 DUF4388 domain-containing protein [Anabaena sp. CCAP 1446/1C]MCM2409647.1 DUF4388 domain-containing protein [Anabaena sp. CCAP 1446/1C]